MRLRNRIGTAVLGVLFMATSAPALAEDNAVIKGKAVFKGDPSKKAYKRTKLDTTKDPNCAKSKKSIGSWSVILNKKADPVTVRNVMVYVKDGLGDRKFDTPKEPVMLDQHGCEYKPHVLGIMAGQPLKIRNDDDTNHNIHFLPKVNQEMNFTQPKKGMEKDVTLTKEAPFKVKCDVHPWMGCYIGVFEHPFFSVTGKDGTFELKGLPPGKYVVEAWHEKFGSQTMTVEVASGDTKEADFTFEPE